MIQIINKQANLLLLVSIFFLFSTSCSYKSKNILFKTVEKVKTDEAVIIVNGTKSNELYYHRISKGDRLLVRLINSYDAEKTTINEGGSSAEAGFLVDYEGNVTLPMIGAVNLENLTRLEASRKLEKLYVDRDLLVNPIIEVNIINLQVIVLGEVGSQGKYLIDREKTNLVDVLADAGGMTIRAKLKTVKIIRGDLANPKIIIVDMRKIESLQSKELILQNNDIVYVEPFSVYLAGDKTQSITNLVQPFLLLFSTAAIIYTITR